MHAAADCEERSEGYLEQDVNAWSSLAYLAGAVAIAALVQRRRVPGAFAVLAGAVALEGLGSFLFHGRRGDAAQLLHDVPLVGMLGFVAGWHVGRLRGGAERVAVAGLAAATAVGASLWVVAPSATNVAVAALVASIAGGSVLAWRRGLPPVWDAALVGLVGLALFAWIAGTTDSPLCDPGSLLQPHALWHLLSAILVLVWIDRAAGAMRPESGPQVLRAVTDHLRAGSSMLLRRLRTGAFGRSDRR